MTGKMIKAESAKNAAFFEHIKSGHDHWYLPAAGRHGAYVWIKLPGGNMQTAHINGTLKEAQRQANEAAARLGGIAPDLSADEWLPFDQPNPYT